MQGFLDAVTARLAAAAGHRLAGVWLLGSGALGGFDPATSDVDVQGVTTEPLDRGERLALAAELAEHARCCPARGLELVLYASRDLRDPAGPAFQLNLNAGPRIEHHLALDPAGDPRFWFILDVDIARQRAVTLAGAPAAAVLPSLPRDLVAGAAHEALAWWSAHDPAAAVVAASRTLAWLEDGRWRSKREAVEHVRAARGDLAGVVGLAAARLARAARTVSEP